MGETTEAVAEVIVEWSPPFPRVVVAFTSRSLPLVTQTQTLVQFVRFVVSLAILLFAAIIVLTSATRRKFLKPWL